MGKEKIRMDPVVFSWFGVISVNSGFSIDVAHYRNKYKCKCVYTCSYIHTSLTLSIGGPGSSDSSIASSTSSTQILVSKYHIT